MIGRNITSTFINSPTPVCNSQTCNATIYSRTHACGVVKPVDRTMWSQHFRVTWLQLIVVQDQTEVILILSQCAVKFQN